MLDSDRNRRIVTIREEIDSGRLMSRRSAYFGNVSSNVDHQVDKVLAKRFGRQKREFSWKKMMTVALVLFMVFTALPQLLLPLYAGFESDVVIVLDPSEVRVNDTLWVNVSIPSMYNITSVRVVVPNVETIGLELVDNSTDMHLWSGVWVVRTLPPGEHMLSIRALDRNNTGYSAGVGLTVLPTVTPVDNESDDNETTPPPDSGGGGSVPVPPVTVVDNESGNETVAPVLDLSLFSDKMAYMFDDLVSINGSVLFNNSLVNASVNLSIFGPGFESLFSLNASNGSFDYEFFADMVGRFEVWANVSFGNLSILEMLDFSVFMDHGYEPVVDSEPVSLPADVEEKIAVDEKVQVILEYEPGVNLTIIREYLESIGFVPTAEITGSGFIAGMMNKEVYDTIKFNSDILSIYEDQGFTVLLSESLPLVGYDDVIGEFNLTGSGKKICIIDTGVDSSVVNYSYGYDFVNDDVVPDDEYGHGTSVAAIINGIAPDAELVVAKVIDGSGVGFESDVLEALEWCVAQDPDVISFSIGSVGVCDGFCDVNFVADMANDAVDLGIFVVAASGNDGGSSLRSPACGSKVFSVGATDDSDVIAGFSNVNPTLDLFAPGVDINTVAGSGSGTSFSAPHVSAAALLVLENESLTPSELKYRLRSTGEPISYVYNSSVSLVIGRLDIYNAITNVKMFEPYDYSWWWQGELTEGEEYVPSGFGWFGVDSGDLDSCCGNCVGGANYLEDALDATGYWIHSVSEDHWFVIDLGDVYVIDTLRSWSITTRDPIDVDIYLSFDGVSFGSEVVSNIATWQDTAAWQEVDMPGTAARYIKVEVDDTEDIGLPGDYLYWGSVVEPIQGIFDAEVELGNATVYYFDEDDGTEWASNPDNMHDGSIATFASTSEQEDLEVLSENTCDGSDPIEGGSTITQVEIRAYGYYVGADYDIMLTPYIEGSPGTPILWDVGGSGAWSEWYDITRDFASLTWEGVAEFDCWVTALGEEAGPEWTSLVAKVEIRVKFNESEIPYADNVTISCAHDFTLDPLVGDYDYHDNNSDPESGSYYKWWTNESGSWQQIAGATTQTLDSNITNESSWYKFEVTPKNAGELGNPVNSSAFQVTGLNESAGTYSGVYDESGNLTILGSGNLTITGTSDFDGCVRIDQNGVLDLGSNNHDFGSLYVNKGNLTGTSGILNITSEIPSGGAAGHAIYFDDSVGEFDNNDGTIVILTSNYTDVYLRPNVGNLNNLIINTISGTNDINWIGETTLEGNLTITSGTFQPKSEDGSALTAGNVTINGGKLDGYNDTGAWSAQELIFNSLNMSSGTIDEPEGGMTISSEAYDGYAVNISGGTYTNHSGFIAIYTNDATSKSTNLRLSPSSGGPSGLYISLPDDTHTAFLQSSCTLGLDLSIAEGVLDTNNNIVTASRLLYAYAGGIFNSSGDTVDHSFGALYSQSGGTVIGSSGSKIVVTSEYANYAINFDGSFTANSGTIEVNTPAATLIDIAATGNLYKLIIDTSDKTVTSNAAATISNNLTIQSGKLQTTADHTIGEIDINSGGEFEITNDVNLTMTGILTQNGYFNITNGNAYDVNLSNTKFNLTNVENVSLFTPTVPSDPENWNNISKYVNITNASSFATVDINITYSDDDLGSIVESTLVVKEYNWTTATWSDISDTGVSTSGNYVWANTVTDFSIFGPMGQEEVDETISVTPSSWNLGTTTLGEYNISTGPYFNLSNEGNTALDIQVMSSNATNSTTGALWVVNDTAGLDNFTIGFNLTGGDTWTLFNYSYVTFVTNLAVSSWQTFDLNLTMATMATKTDPLNLTVTFRAVAS